MAGGRRAVRSFCPGWGQASGRERETEVGVSEEEWGGRRCPRASGAIWWLGGWGRGLFEEGQLCGAYSGSLGPWVGPGSGWAGGRTIVDCSYSQDTNAFTLERRWTVKGGSQARGRI